MCWRSLERAGLPNMATNSTNGRVYDRAAQTQRVSIRCICDKRRLEMLAVRPLIRQNYIQFEGGKIIQ